MDVIKKRCTAKSAKHTMATDHTVKAALKFTLKAAKKVLGTLSQVCSDNSYMTLLTADNAGPIVITGSAQMRNSRLTMIKSPIAERKRIRGVSGLKRRSLLDLRSQADLQNKLVAVCRIETFAVFHKLSIQITGEGCDGKGESPVFHTHESAGTGI